MDEKVKGISLQNRLIGLHLDCEVNYARLIKLCADNFIADRYCFVIDASRHQCLDIEVLERAPYTTFLKVKGHLEKSLSPISQCWANFPEMNVRVYHDLQMVEVVSAQYQRVAKLHYRYPNKQMFQADEKKQLNAFLGMCLQYFVRHTEYDACRKTGSKWGA